MKFPSLTRTICLLLLVLFGLETLLMYLVPYFLPFQKPWLATLTDAFLLTLLFAPVLHRFIFKPFQEVAAAQKSLTENLMAHLVDGVVIFDRSLAVHSLNSAAEGIFGYDAAEIVGADARVILGDSCPEGLYELSHAGEGEFCQIEPVRECTGKRKDGSEVPIEFSLSQVSLGGRRMWLGIIRDITARKRDEERVKETLSLLSATLEATADGVMVRDLAGKIVIYNQRFSEMWRIPREVMDTRNDKLMRAHVLEQLKEPDRFLEITEKLYVLTDQETNDILSFKDGRVFQRYSAPQIIDDKIVGRVICCRDITEQYNLEHQLRHAQKMEALGILAGGVAHDFNNILTVVMGFCNLTAVQLEEKSPLKHNLDQIMTASHRALTLTNTLLAYSRKQPMNRRPLDLTASVQKTEKFLARLIGEDIELITRLCPEKIMVLADSGQLEQVLMNLAANARDAMERKGCLAIETRKLEIGPEFVKLHGYGKPGTFAQISISDTGIGMDEETREKIFEPFFTTKQVGQGTGLGLSIVYGIVKQHDGYINVYSEPEKGTTFNIYLPVITATEEAVRTVQQQVAGGSETLLLAEDDPGVRALVKSVLTGSGYRVIEAGDGEEAVGKFQGHRDEIDLLILDVVMPKKNGREAFEEINVIKPETKAIFISGYTADIVDKNGLVEYGVHLIMKPLLPNQLLCKIREVLDGGARSEGEAQKD